MSGYIEGNFDKKIALKGKPDEVNACIALFHILGEELKSRTVSRDYLEGIFNSATDMVFIVSRRGKILDTNRQVYKQLGIDSSTAIGMSMNMVLSMKSLRFSEMKRALMENSELGPVRSTFSGAGGVMIPVELTTAWLLNMGGKSKQLIISAKDISKQLALENEVLRAIIEGEEAARGRLALDLHESLGQKISGIKFYISACANALSNSNGDIKNTLYKANDALSSLHKEVRNLCFDLLPQSLEAAGLVEAVRELCHQDIYRGKISFRVGVKKGFVSIGKSWEVDVFRIVQEFISNAIQHGRASNITISFDGGREDERIVRLKDNGKGFKLSKRSKGKGLENVRTRVRSQGGQIFISSSPGRGTTFLLTFNPKQLCL